MANQEQLEILKQGIEVWNKWRNENPNVEVDLIFGNLVGADLIGANLVVADLSGAKLNGAFLNFADLSGANLVGADLNGAFLVVANLSETDLSGAKLVGADLDGADLSGANLIRADLSEAFLRRALLYRADLSGAKLHKADLSGAKLIRADLVEADLVGADLSGADLIGANLNGAKLFGVKLSPDQQNQIEEAMRYREAAEKAKAERNSRERAEHGSMEAEEENAVIANNGSVAAEKIQVGGNFSGNLTIGNNKEVRVSSDEVIFTAYHPKEGIVDFWYTLLVYAHTLSVLEKIKEDVKRFKDQIKAPKETTTGPSALIIRGTELTIVPSCEGVTFNPERVTLKWMEDFHRADFRFKADQSLSGDAAKGSIDIYVGPLIIGTLKFAMLFNEKEVQPVPDHEEHAKMYGKDDVFISYSRKDSEVARTFKTVLEGTGLDVFLDVDDIRSGQLWEDELKRRIERAKVFQVFWSANYSQSKNCKQEWEYALKQNKEEGYIRPVFWEKPLSPKPPEELNKFNFKYVELKIANGI